MQQKTVPKSGSLTGFDCAHSIRSGFVKATGLKLLFGPVMPYAVVSCRICSFYIKFHKAAQFKPYCVQFDVFYSNLKYSRTILTRSVKNRLSCRQAGGQPGLPAAHSQIALNSSGQRDLRVKSGIFRVCLCNLLFRASIFDAAVRIWITHRIFLLFSCFFA